MKIGLGVSKLWEVENRPLPLTRPMAYTTACTTVQAVIVKTKLLNFYCRERERERERERGERGEERDGLFVNS